jgi:hypothetical protein
MNDNKFYVPNRLEIKPGDFYFVAKCPNTKKILAIRRDPDRGNLNPDVVVMKSAKDRM